MKKLLKSIVISILIIFIFVNSAFAAITLEDLKGNPQKAEGIQNAGGQLITIISVVGSIISVIVLVALGIKYMLGSVEEKAQYKKTLLPYVIGAVFVFAGSTIAGIIYGIINK